MIKPIELIFVILAAIGGLVVFITAIDFFHSVYREAVDKQKLVEFGSLLISLLALTISVMSAIYSAHANSKTAQRVERLEKHDG